MHLLLLHCKLDILMLTEYIVFSGIVGALLCILLLIAKKFRNRSDNLLILWLLISAGNLFYYLFSLPGRLESFGFSLPVLSTPLLYLYVRALTFKQSISNGCIVKHSLFYFVYSLSFTIISLFYLPIQFRYNIPYFKGGGHSILLDLLTLPMAVIPIIYISLCFIALKKYQRQIPDFYSNLEKSNLNWLKYIFISLFSLFLVILGVISFSSEWKFVPLHRVFKVVGAIQSMYLLSIVFFSLRQSIVFNHVALPFKEPKTSEVNEKSKELADKLKRYMETNKPYLREELSLPELASMLSLSTNQLSHLINETLHSSFYMFVNGYRIKEVKQKLKDPAFDHYSILGIAFDSGFNSKSTFNKFFKEETGLTPSQYRKSP